MALRCDHCRKGVQYGHNVSHSKRRTRRIFKPNLHSARIMLDGRVKRMRLCTKCLRLVKSQAAAAAKKAAQKPKEVKKETKVAPVAQTG